MELIAQEPQAIHYLPIATTFISAAFCIVLLRRFFVRSQGMHLLWWAGGVFCYGAGTALEASVTLFGNSPELNKAWYIVGAFLGGYPLAQGTVYLLLKRRTANILSSITLPFIVVLSTLVVISPTNLDALEAHRPGGAALGWQWLRLFTVPINIYAVVFLIGGAILSAVRYFQHTSTRGRAIGNALIAFGALLPGIGGSMAKAGIVEALYLGEFVGLLFIWAGYVYCVRTPRVDAQITTITKDRATVAVPARESARLPAASALEPTERR